MSFILDAIAKSEQERQQQLAPDARRLAVPTPAPVREHSKLPYVISAALLLNAVLIGVWVQSGQQEAPIVESGEINRSARPESASGEIAPSDTPEKPPESVPADVPQPSSTTPMLAESTVEKAPAAQTPRPKAKPESQAPSSAVLEKIENPVVPEPQPAVVISVPAATETREASLDSTVGADRESVVAALEEAPEPVPPEASERRISRLSELPSDVRRALPSVVFTGHLYSSNPRASYVFVGDRQVVVGQQIVDNLVLDAITPTGVVVEFHEYLIEVGVLQNWSLN